MQKKPGVGNHPIASTAFFAHFLHVSNFNGSKPGLFGDIQLKNHELNCLYYWRGRCRSCRAETAGIILTQQLRSFFKTKNPRRVGRSGYWSRKMRTEDPRFVFLPACRASSLLFNLAAAQANKRQTECAEHRATWLGDHLEHANRAIRSRSLEAHYEQVFTGWIIKGS